MHVNIMVVFVSFPTSVMLSVCFNSQQMVLLPKNVFLVSIPCHL